MSRATTMMMAAMGCTAVNQVSHTARRSSPKLRAQLLKGSGTVFTAARAEALVPCAVRATPPARSAAAQRHSGETAPVAPVHGDDGRGGGRRQRCERASQMVSRIRTIRRKIRPGRGRRRSQNDRMRDDFECGRQVDEAESAEEPECSYGGV